MSASARPNIGVQATAYSVRQVDPYLPGSLEKVYAHLNLIDPAAGGHRSGNRWGGSADIGGSPRSSGTRVSPEQIARACEHAFSPPPPYTTTCPAFLSPMTRSGLRPWALTRTSWA